MTTRRDFLKHVAMDNETPSSRRAFLAATGLAAAGAALPGHLSAAPDETPTKRKPIKIGQIGTANQHAYKIGSLRRLPDLFEIVGFVEDDPKRRERALKSSSFKGLKVMSIDELLAVPGLQAVAVETEERVCIPPALRCIRAGKHIHLDKPAGESLPQFKLLLDERKPATSPSRSATCTETTRPSSSASRR